ncbi:MAG: trigger factor [Nitrospirae bacterium]|nr:trigger factor [Nitrospirota bacterium]
MSLKVNVEKKSETLRAFHVEVSPEEVVKEFEGAYSNLQRRVSVPGFRRGKVPRGLLEQRYGKEVENDVIQKLVPESYRKALKDSGCVPVEAPHIETLEIRNGAPLTFTALVEIKPEIGRVGLDGLEIVSAKPEVTDEEVMQTLAHLQDTHSQLEVHPDDHAAEKGDFLSMDYEGFLEDHPLPSSRAEGALIEIGSGRLVPGFEEGLIGTRKGEARDLRITFPEDYHAKDIAGKEVHFKIQVREIKKKVSPALDDEFARDLGEYDSLEDLKVKVREEIRNRKEEERINGQREAALRFLVEKNPVPAPQPMVNEEIHRIFTRNFSSRGQEMNLPEEEQRRLVEEIRPHAERNVKAALLMEFLGKAERIEPSDEEVAAELDGLAGKTRQDPEKVRDYFRSHEEALENLKGRVRERKIMAFMLSKAAIKETP